jgi:bifunctional UDP-N-acetylglucosamine pyrophosphorylase/glucosamine-1-phosphate N-acetyltransferase
MPAPTPSSPPAAIILAAGKGTRMKSELPKVLHEVGGHPMVCAVIDACRQAGCDRVVLVVGYKQELVRAAIAEHGMQAGVEFAEQPEQLGTGHAVRCARPLFADQIAPGAPGHDTFVLAGDGPLIRAETLARLLATHREASAAATLATSVIDDPTGYGRIARDAAGRFLGIVEHRDCTPDQLRIREVNPSYYCFDTRALFSALERVDRNPASGEYYITDVPAAMMAQGLTVEVIAAVPPQDILSINTLEQLAEVDAIYRSRRAGGAGVPTRTGSNA